MSHRVALCCIALFGCRSDGQSDLTSKVGAARAEVAPIFAELRIRLEQARVESGSYPASLGEKGLHPATGDSLEPLPDSWAALRFRPPAGRVSCRYAWVTGPAGGGEIGPIGIASRFEPPATDWFYLVATCGGGGDYFTSSVDPSIKP
jgi:hypothetical protein